MITFDLNGKEYTYEANYNYDWFDIKILDFINQILREEKSQKQLYFMSDGYQECIIFYCDKEWANLFEKETGYKLNNSTK